ncbi:MAG: 5-carboxymethyl-2-hydroxymuconate isomerase [Gammaproteobacteria bacterium]|nr:5-carboxymethyl-2-hydroxymuconate isomerase [Gammaproteobacteria bacterium]
MPHFIIEYSSNLDDEIKMQKLMSSLQDAALETGAFPLGGIRFRAVRCDKYLIADGDPENAFVHMTLKIGHGRDESTRKEVGEKLFEALKSYFNPLFEKRPLGLSFELVELHENLSFKENNIHQYIRQKQN